MVPFSSFGISSSLGAGLRFFLGKKLPGHEKGRGFTRKKFFCLDPIRCIDVCASRYKAAGKARILKQERVCRGRVRMGCLAVGASEYPG